MRLLTLIAKRLAYLASGIVIIAASFVLISLLATPLFIKHLTDIEKWTSELLGQPVSIQKADLSWYRYQPVISLSSVTLKEKNSLKPKLQIKKVILFFSIPQSIWQKKPILTGILISGASLNINETIKGQYSIQGYPLSGKMFGSYQEESTLPSMLGWLINQPKIILKNIDIHYTGLKKYKRFVTLNELSLINSLDAHVILGKAILHQQLSTEVTIAIRWLGKELDLSKIRAKIYLYASGISLNQWLANATWNGWQVKQGLVSAKIWANWHLGQFRKIQSIFRIYKLNLYSQLDKSTHSISRLSGHIGWRIDTKNKQQIIAGDDLLIDFKDHLWPLNNFYLTLKSNENGQLNSGAINFAYLDLSDMQKFIFSSTSNYLPVKTQELLSKINLKGALANTSLKFSSPFDWSNILISTDFNHISFAAYSSFPALNNLSGKFLWDKNIGQLNLASQETELIYNNWFNQPVILNSLSGRIKFQELIPEKATVNKNWFISIPSLHFENPDIKANLEGVMNLKSDDIQKSNFNLSGNAVAKRIQNITHYLPMKVFDKELANWLKHAFLSGEIKSVNGILKGELKDFPFTNSRNDIFKIDAQVSNVNLFYADNWPLLKNIDGRVTFLSKQVDINLNQGKIFDIPLTNVVAQIPDLSAETVRLQVKSEAIKTDFSKVLNFVQNSPLQNKIGKMFKTLEVNGPTQLDLELNMPLSDPDKTEVKGKLNLMNAQINLHPWNFKLSDIKGLVNFTEQTIKADEIKAQLFKQPIIFKISPIQDIKKNNLSEITSSTNISITDLEQWLNIPFSKYAQGKTLVKIKIDFSLNGPIQIYLNSNLIGLNLDIADQLKKPTYAAKDFTSEIIAEEGKTLRIKISYDHNLHLAMILNKLNQSFNLNAAALFIGEGDFAWPEKNGLYITGHFADLNWEQIKNYLFLSEENKPEILSKLPLQTIIISADKFNLANEKINNAKVQIKPLEDQWEIQIASSEITGKITLPSQFNHQGIINAQFEKFHLHTSVLENQTINFDNYHLPAINFIADDVNYNHMELGHVMFKTHLTPDGQSIDQFNIISPRMNFYATGSWIQKAKQNVSQLTGKIKSNLISELLTSLGFDVHNIILGTGSLDFKLKWNDALYAPNLTTLNGNARLELGSGRIIEVSQTSSAKLDIGRMLSIFSLQSLPRRLALDFRDVFEKGYSFNKIFGDFTIRDGNLFTSNLYLDGPVARIGINGRIGLKNRDYDLILSITPYITSTLPLAATLLTMQPLVGLAAFAINTVIDASRAATYYYSVKGPWVNPTWHSVKGVQ